MQLDVGEWGSGAVGRVLDSNLNMLQRHQRASLDQILQYSRERLESDFEILKNSDLRKIQLSKTAELILDMYSNISYPMTCLSVVKENFEHLKHPHSLQLEMILDKAEMFYIESVTHDLNKLKDQQRILTIPLDDIKDYIQEINWKHGYDRDSILNESQEIGDNIDLMKFFEGVRNFQNEEELQEKKCIEKLKRFAIDTENQLTFRRGFLTARLASIIASHSASNSAHFFAKAKQQVKANTRLTAFNKMVRSKYRLGLEKIIKFTQTKNDRESLGELLMGMHKKSFKRQLMSFFRKMSSYSGKLKILNKTVQRIQERKQWQAGSKFFSNMSSPGKIRILNLGGACEKLNHTLKKQAAKKIIAALKLPLNLIVRVLHASYLKTVDLSVREIRLTAEENRPKVLPISRKMKAKMLLSLQKHEKKPIDMRKTFLSWYLKGQEQKYAKMMYNILLNNKTSKFTFFMRVKNCVNESKKMKVKPELKIFLLCMMQRLNGYYNHCQKGFIGKWHQRFKYCKSLLSVAKHLEHLEVAMDSQNERVAIELIRECAVHKTLVRKYMSKRLGNVMRNAKAGFDIWKAIPNIKKTKGRLMLMKILQQKLQVSHQGHRNTFEAFKLNKVEGHSKKMTFITKVFAKDLLYLSIFLNNWRTNVRAGNYKNISHNKDKAAAIAGIVSQLRRKERENIRDGVRKFQITARFIVFRKKQSLKVFSKLMDTLDLHNMRDSFLPFLSCLQSGRVKKERLVIDLVNANRLKQAEVFVFLKTMAFDKKEEEKAIRVREIIHGISEHIKFANDVVFTPDPTYKVLQKIGMNYSRNADQMLNSLRSLPLRINWRRKAHVLDLHSKLSSLVNRDKVGVMSKFKDQHSTGQFQKKKMLDIMTFNYIDCTKNYFKMYLNTVREIKMKEKHLRLTATFDSLLELSHSNFEILFQGEKVWQKKMSHLKMLDSRMKDKMKQAIKLWHSSARTISHYNQITNEKKIKLLGFVSEILKKNSYTETKHTIQLFHKNLNIIKIQTKFLNKLCDSQAGKVIKAMMIWKNLPKPANKEIIAKASKFESGLFRFAQKMVRFPINKFKDEHYVGNDRKKMAIRKLVAKSCSGIDKYFSIWKKNNELITLFSKCHQVERLAQIIATAQLENYRLLLDGDISQRVERSFMKIGKWWDRKKQGALAKWRKAAIRMKRSDELKAKALMGISEMEKTVRVRKIVSVIKNLKTQAFLRKVIIGHFVSRNKLRAHEGLSRIRNLPDWRRKARELRKRQSLLRAVTLVSAQELRQKNLVLSSFREEKHQGNLKKLKDSLSNEMESAQVTLGKKNALNRMFSALEAKRNECFGIWSSRTKEMRMQRMLDNANKKTILERINKMISGSSNEKVKQSIKLFYNNFKVQKVQRRFIEKLLQTKSGKVAEAFMIWKDLPTQNMMEKYKKGQKFYFKLEALVKGKLKSANNQFVNDKEEGGVVKKQSVIKLLDITSNGVRRYYNRWETITRRDLTLKQATHVMSSIEIMHQNLANTFMIVFADQRSTKIKTWAIQRLIQSSNQSVGRYFSVWRSINREHKMRAELMQQEKKGALQLFTRVLGTSSLLQARQIVLKFKKNSHIAQISRNFLNKLLRTKSGKVMQLFEIWKKLPSAKLAARKKRAIKFESNLHKISNKIMKKGFEPFKSESYEAKNKKRACIDRLIRASMGEEKKKFILWREIVKEEKMLAHTHLFDALFERMQGVITNNMRILVKDSSKEIAQKKGLCRKLINNSNFVQHHAYFVWKEALQTDNVKIEKQEGFVKVKLTNLINLEQKNRNKRLIEVLSKFKAKHSQQRKVLADGLKDQKSRRAILLHDRLSKLSDDRLSAFLKTVATQHFEVKLINKNKSIENSFECLNLVLGENFKVIMRTNRETVIIEKALNQIFSNVGMSMSKVFNVWRENKNILAMQSAMSNEKKKNVLNILNKFMSQQEKSKIPMAVKKFEKNYKMTKLMRDILTKICQCKAGKVPLAFMVWKSLPNPGAKKIKQKASKFESSLARLHFKKLKGTYEKFRNEQYDGNVKKKQAINKLIMVTMSDNNRFFNKWRKTTSEAAITEKMIGLTQSFQHCSACIKQHNYLFENPTQDLLRKEAAIKQLVRNNSLQLSNLLQIWRFNIKDEKCYLMEKALQRFSPSEVNTRNLRGSFDRIKKKADMEILRAYINSLWKWKMSNVEANYYAKFIKVFRESEELLILSNIFNRKKYEHLHNGFRAILSEGVERQQRKYQITEKYLTRKLSNYFQRFKLNACFEQIKSWRNTYKDTVRGNNLVELIERFARKQQKFSFDSILGAAALQTNVLALEKNIQKLQGGFKRNAFEAIRQAGYQRFLEKISKSFNGFKMQRLGDAFQRIRLTSYVVCLEAKMVKTVNKELKRHALNKIQARSNRIARYRIGLKFMAYAQQQVMKAKTSNVIRSFKKTSDKAHALRSITTMLLNKERLNMEQLFRIGKDSIEKSLLLSRFMKGMKVKKILDKQDRKIMGMTLAKLKKKENRWIAESVKRFVLRSHIKSSMAVSLWRLRNMEEGNQR